MEATMKKSILRSRLEMYREIAEKIEQNAEKKQMEPKDRDYAKEHSLTIEQQQKRSANVGRTFVSAMKGDMFFEWRKKMEKAM